ncbi:MAG: hypothetical protein MN733_00100 [Nitrososphaera sp.]|nr:hypothetical protein [Nitrososphaera sp.]
MDVLSREITQITAFNEERQLVTTEVSGDGTTLVFDTSSLDGNRIFVVHTDGTGLREVSNLNCSGSPSIRFDGQKITFIACRGEARDVYIVNDDGSGLQRILEGVSFPISTYARISSDGSKVFVVTNDHLFGPPPSNLLQLYAVNPDGSGLVQLTNDENIAWYGPRSPQVSHNGRYALFVSASDPVGANPEHTQNLFRIRSDDAAIEQITQAPEPPCDGADSHCVPFSNWISSDGAKVVYMQQWRGCSDELPCLAIVRRNSDGTARENLLPLDIPADITLVGASSDLTTVIFASDGDFIGENPQGASQLCVDR